MDMELETDAYLSAVTSELLSLHFEVTVTMTSLMVVVGLPETMDVTALFITVEVNVVIFAELSEALVKLSGLTPVVADNGVVIMTTVSLVTVVALPDAVEMTAPLVTEEVYVVILVATGSELHGVVTVTMMSLVAVLTLPEVIEKTEPLFTVEVYVVILLVEFITFEPAARTPDEIAIDLALENVTTISFVRLVAWPAEVMIAPLLAIEVKVAKLEYPDIDLTSQGVVTVITVSFVTLVVFPDVVRTAPLLAVEV